MAKLGEVFSLIRNGANIKQGDDNRGYPITRIETIANRTIDRNRMGYAGITDISKYESYVLQTGDILMSHINSVAHLGKVALYKKQKDETIIHGMNLLCLRPKQRIILPEFAYYYFSSGAFLRQLPSITKKSVNQASFNISALRELDFPNVDIEKQKSIVQILDSIQHLISLRVSQFEKLDQLVKSQFIEMFGDPNTNPYGWQKTNFQAISELITDGEHATPRRTASGIYLLSARNVLDHKLDLHDVDYIDQDEYDRIAKRIAPRAGDILISCSGTVGRVCSVPDNFKFQMVRSVALVRFKTDINPVFMEHQIAMPFIQDQINAAKSQSAQANLFQGKIKQLVAIVPPAELQNRFLRFVEQTDKSKLAIQQSLEQLETLKKSLMQKYFG